MRKGLESARLSAVATQACRAADNGEAFVERVRLGTGLRLISNTETPGLGANAANPAFTDKFAEKTGTPALTVVKAGMGSGAENEIDAIASATITSTAVTKAAQAGLDVAAQLTKEGEN